MSPGAARMRTMSCTPRRVFRLVLALSAAAGCASAAHAGDPPLSLGAVYGYGDRANVYGVQVAWAPRFDSDLLERNDLDLRFSGQVARWLARANQVEHGSLTDSCIMTELRYRLSRTEPNRPFVEIGLGLHLISHVQISTRNLGTAFDFGTQVAAGFTYGENGRYELAALISHASNGSIKYPNDGFTYGAIRFRVALP